MNNYTIIGSIDGNYKNKIAKELIEKMKKEFPDAEAEIYFGYPIYVDEYTKNRTNVDIAIVSTIGVYIINILESSVSNYCEIQDEIYNKVHSKLSKHKFLFKKKKLVFELNSLTISKEIINEDSDFPLFFDTDKVINYIKETSASIDSSLYDGIISGLQEAYGINSKEVREDAPEGTKAYSINQMSSLIEKYDSRQMEAVLIDPKGIQRIRGMAGSGKTIILARKAVELHTAHPDWDIVVTYSTRTVKNQLISLINRFYSSKNDGAKIDSRKLRIMHAWGSATAPGVYYETCITHGITPLTVQDAKIKYHIENVFPVMCRDLLNSIDKFKKMYDCILIDEAQDFEKNFLNLCLRILDKNERLVYAYDELQKLNEEAMPTPMDIFGKNVKNDTPLTICYRNNGRTIVTAHAIGMGLYSKNGIIQMPGNPSVWEAIGYTSDKKIEENKPVELYRTSETSPNYLGINPNEVIDFSCYESQEEMFNSLLDSLREDLFNQHLIHQDIMIIDMDKYNYVENSCELRKIQYSKFPESTNIINIHSAGALNPEDFFRKDSIVYSSIRRAKGNETYMVYIVNAQKCCNSLQKISDRNSLFTAITRSKGWVRVLGFGDDMIKLCDEFDTVKKYDYRLHFDNYPDEEQRKKIVLNNRDVKKEEQASLENTKNIIENLTKDGRFTKKQIIKELLGIDSDQEIREILDEE